jgi:uncharacterized protein YggT (Ycf19 family)
MTVKFLALVGRIVLSSFFQFRLVQTGGYDFCRISSRMSKILLRLVLKLKAVD